MRQYHAEIEFDFDERGWDLLDVYRGRMSLRKLKVRLDGLPWESRFGQAILGGPHIPQSEALASIVDLLQVQLWQNSGNENAPRPKPFPRVGDDLRETAKVDAREARALAWLAESKALKGGE